MKFLLFQALTLKFKGHLLRYFSFPNQLGVIQVSVSSNERNTFHKKYSLA